MAEVNGKKTKDGAKDTFYFSHDMNARNDPKILRLRQAHGNAGYAVYFMLIEILREQPEHKLATKDIELFTHDLRCDIDTLKSIIHEFDLFVIEADELMSARLIRSMGAFNSLKQKRMEAGRKGGLSKAKALLKGDLKQSSSKAKAVLASKPSKRREENRREENRREEKYPPDSDEIRLASLLRDFLFSEDEKTKAPNLQKWADEIGLMMRVDGLDVGEIERLVQWSKKDGCWWRDKILSTANLRKHAEKMRRQMKEEIGRNGGGLKKGEPVDFGKLGEEFD